MKSSNNSKKLAGQSEGDILNQIQLAVERGSKDIKFVVYRYAAIQNIAMTTTYLIVNELSQGLSDGERVLVIGSYFLGVFLLLGCRFAKKFINVNERVISIVYCFAFSIPTIELSINLFNEASVPQLIAFGMFSTSLLNFNLMLIEGRAEKLLMMVIVSIFILLRIIIYLYPVFNYLALVIFLISVYLHLLTVSLNNKKVSTTFNYIMESLKISNYQSLQIRFLSKATASQILLISKDLENILVRSQSPFLALEKLSDDELLKRLMNSKISPLNAGSESCSNSQDEGFRNILLFKWHECKNEEVIKLHCMFTGDSSLSGEETAFKVSLCKLEGSDKGDGCWLLMIKLNSSRAYNVYNQMKSKDDLLVSVAHDLRTPLNNIVALLSIVLGLVNQNERKLRKYISLAKDSAGSLLFMVNDLLDFSQIAQGRLKNLNFEKHALGRVLAPIMCLFKFTAKKKGVKLQANYGKYEETLVMIDDHRLQQILMNLIGNALKFTNSGGTVRVLVSNVNPNLQQDSHRRFTTSFLNFNHNSSPNYKHQSHNDHANQSKETVEENKRKALLYIIVEDNGIGVREENLPLLFTPFNSFEKNINKNGVGLGLSISQNLSKLLAPDLPDAGISVNSTFGEGSRFWFPIQVALEGTSVKKLAKRNTDEKIQRIELQLKEYNFAKSIIGGRGSDVKRLKKNILIVDDDQINLFVMKMMISKLYPHFTIDLAVNGFDAFKKVKQTCEDKNYFHIIFMDKNMPVCGGLQASQLIDEFITLGGHPSIPLYILTGSLCQHMEEKEINEKGVKKWLSKPLDQKDLVKIISNHL